MPETTNDLQRETEQFKKQKEKLEAEKALAEAQRALDAVKSQSAENVQRLKTQKELSDAQKEAANAQFEAWKAQYFGTVTGANYSGAVDLKDGAGKAEAALLAARAVRIAAANICNAVKALSAKVDVFAAKEFPDFQRLQTFRFQLAVLKQAFAVAGVSAQAEVTAVATPAAVSAGLAAFSNILSFFKTDYTTAGIQLTVDESLLLYSVAGNLAKGQMEALADISNQLSEKEKTAADATDPKVKAALEKEVADLKAKAEKVREVYLPITYSSNAEDSAITALASDLRELRTLRSQAESDVASISSQQREKERAVEGETEQNKKDACALEVAGFKAKGEKLKGVVTLFDSFVNALTSADPKTGVVPLANLVREYAIEQAIKNGHDVLLLRLESTGGGYFLKKNLWTGLGKMPLYHMGGATVTYVLLSGRDGKVLAGDVVPVHGGFVKAGELEQKLNTILPLNS